MKYHRPRRAHPAARDRGFALIAFLLLVVLVSSYVIADQLTRTNSELSKFREDRSMNALRQAKAALIAYAASEQWQSSLGQVIKQPGALPCPVNDDSGTSPGVCDGAANRIGRLPWKTIGTDDFRDASGERLWYAVSSTFRKKDGTTVINSDTQGLLSVTALPPDTYAVATNVVAVVFAPGARIQNQDRPASAALPAHNDPSNYLESFLATGSDYTYRTSTLPSDTFNDRLLAITQAELMAVVEPAVAARIERDVKPYLRSHSSGWSSAFPFAAPFLAGGVGPGRAQSYYKGIAGQTNGLPPLTNEANWVVWQSPPVPVITGIPGAGTGDESFTYSCSLQSGNTVVSCRVDYSNGNNDRPAIQLQATLANAGLSFVNPVAQGDKVMTNHDSVAIDWDATGLPLFPPTVTNTMLPNGNGMVVFRGRLLDGESTEGRVTIEIPKPAYHPITNPADPTAGWFVKNEWYRQTYFAVSPGYLPDGSGTCNPLPGTPSCLTVSKLPPKFVQFNDKRAILLLAGRSLNNAGRPSNSLPDYLEGANLSAAQSTSPYRYEHRAGVPTAINDRVVVVAP